MTIAADGRHDDVPVGRDVREQPAVDPHHVGIEPQDHRSVLGRGYRRDVDLDETTLAGNIECRDDRLVRRLRICPHEYRQIAVVPGEPLDRRLQRAPLVVDERPPVDRVGAGLRYRDLEALAGGQRRRLGIRLGQAQD